MSKFNLLVKSNEDLNKFPNATQAQKNLKISIKSISYAEVGEQHSTYFKQLKAVVQTLTNDFTDNKQKKLSTLAPEQTMMILLGAALFTQKQIKETYFVPIIAPIIKINISSVVKPSGTLGTHGSDLYQSIDKLPAILNMTGSDNADQVKTFAKRAFYEWYQKSAKPIMPDGTLSISDSTAFGENGDIDRNKAESTLEIFAAHLPHIEEDQYLYLITNKNLNQSDYANDLPASSGNIITNAVSGTASLASSAVTGALKIVASPLSYFWAREPDTAPKIEAEKEDSKVVTEQATAAMN